MKSNKNDSRDAEAIAESVTRPTRRFVPIKTVDQQDIQALHRVRERLIGERTALINEVHGLLHEYGIVIPKGVTKFYQTVLEKLAAEQDKLTALSQEMFRKLTEEFVVLEKQLVYTERNWTHWPRRLPCSDRWACPVHSQNSNITFSQARQSSASLWLAYRVLHPAYSTPVESRTGGGCKAYGLADFARIDYVDCRSGIVAAQRISGQGESHPPSPDEGTPLVE